VKRAQPPRQTQTTARWRPERLARLKKAGKARKTA
jgi:hypothetical protein